PERRCCQLCSQRPHFEKNDQNSDTCSHSRRPQITAKLLQSCCETIPLRPAGNTRSMWQLITQPHTPSATKQTSLQLQNPTFTCDGPAHEMLNCLLPGEGRRLRETRIHTHQLPARLFVRRESNLREKRNSGLTFKGLWGLCDGTSGRSLSPIHAK
ncbi:hypothetical protein M758_5G166400, partial [Ceratodon purpureus]